MSVFFLGSWGMNRGAEQTNRPRTANTHSIYLQCFQKGAFPKFFDKRYKFKIPTATGT